MMGVSMSDGSSAGALRFGLLGPVRAFRGAEAVDLGPVRQQAVLAVLLLNAGKPVPAQQIVAALWNGDPPENGIDVVQRCIGGLRRALEPSLLAFTEAGYVLRVDPESVDTGMFRAALAQAHTDYRTGDINAATDQVRGALDLFSDEPLAGLTGAFFQSARDRLNTERTNASQMLVMPAQPAQPTPTPPPAQPTTTPPPAQPTTTPPPAQPAAAPASAQPATPPPARPAAPPPAQPAAPPPARTTAPPAGRPAQPSSPGQRIPAFSPGRASLPGHDRPATPPAEPPAAPARRPGSEAGRPRPPVLDPTRIDTGADDHAYPEAVDPWGDHALFPPDPTAMG
jgi:hypothetical protein